MSGGAWAYGRFFAAKWKSGCIFRRIVIKYSLSSVRIGDGHHDTTVQRAADLKPCPDAARGARRAVHHHRDLH